ncbi:MAG: hypothetical protein L0Z68_05345 [Gammaproteobacteria bacterium]|nr:hypothetical protein [Gammaproteobacteria bacterium]
MDSYAAGQRAAGSIGVNSIRECDAIIEFGVGSGSFLRGIQSITGMGRAKWIGVDPCAEFLRLAPEWIERYQSSLRDFSADYDRALVALSPCLIESTADDGTATHVLRKAVSLARSGVIWFSVHARPEFIARYPAGSESSWILNNHTVTIRTVTMIRDVINMQWEVRDECGMPVYIRQYAVRLCDVQHWKTLAEDLSEVKTFRLYPDDSERGKFRNAFVLEFKHDMY